MKRFAFLLAALAVSGCYKIDYVNGGSPSAYADSTEWHHIAIMGLMEFSEPVALDQICPDGFAKVHHEVSLVNGLVSYIIGYGLYSPSTIEVYCKSGAAYNVEVNDDGLALSAERVQ